MFALLSSGAAAWANAPEEQAPEPVVAADDAPSAEDAVLKVVHQVPAQYPQRAFGQNYGVQKCVAHVWVDATGKAERVKVEKCLMAFHRAVEEAVMAWRWSPPTLQGTPVASRTKVKFDFSDSCASGATECGFGFDDSFFIDAPTGTSSGANDKPRRRGRRQK